MRPFVVLWRVSPCPFIGSGVASSVGNAWYLGLYTGGMMEMTTTTLTTRMMPAPWSRRLPHGRAQHTGASGLQYLIGEAIFSCRKHGYLND
eukprot:33084-Eustigmatos_ZCMA.PRE.1